MTNQEGDPMRVLHRILVAIRDFLAPNAGPDPVTTPHDPDSETFR